MPTPRLKIYSPVSHISTLRCDTSTLLSNTRCFTYRDGSTRSSCPLIFSNNIIIGSENPPVAQQPNNLRLLSSSSLVQDGIAIGRDATSFGDGSIAVGRLAGSADGSIVLNTSASGLSSDGHTGFFVNPIRRSDLAPSNIYPLFHDESTNEIIAVPYDTSIISVGDIKMSVRSSDFNGWLLCDGRALDILTFAQLFAIIGYTFGGSGASFNLPDSRGRVLGSASSSYSVGTPTGNASHQLTLTQMPSHSHGVTNTGHTHGGTVDTSGTHAHSVTNTGHTHTGTTDSSGVHTHTSNATGGAIGLAISDGTNTAPSTDSSPNELNVWTTPQALAINNSGAHTHTFTTGTNASAGVSIDTNGAHTHTFTTATNASAGITINNTGGTDSFSLFQPTLFIGNTFIFAGILS